MLFHRGIKETNSYLESVPTNNYPKICVYVQNCLFGLIQLQFQESENFLLIKL